MSEKSTVVAMDLEGVLTPEVWIAVSQSTGIAELKLTTRDEPDYDVLMRRRLAILRENGLKLRDIQDVIAQMKPLPGALDFLNWLRPQWAPIILSDTYYEFAAPFMAQLGWPTLFCNSLETDAEDNLVDYHLRIRDGKRHATLAFKQLNFQVVAVGDSYNDTSMLAEAHLGILFRPSENVKQEFPQFPVATDYPTMQKYIAEFCGRS